MIVLQGRLDTIRFANPENGYTVARFTPDGYQAEITAVGILAGVRAGETLRMEGEWEKHAKFGEQFRVAVFEVLLPDTARGIRRYLASGVIQGVGAAMAEKLVAYFGTHTLEVLDSSPERLAEVPGIGKAKARTIKESWKSYHAIRTLMALMTKIGASPSAGAKILHAYGTEALNLVQEDPYRICRDIPEVPFEVADRLGLASGLEKESLPRLRAGVLHVLEKAGYAGHVFLPEKDLLVRSLRLLGGSREKVAEALLNLEEEKVIVAEEGEDRRHIYLAEMFGAEAGIGARLSAMLSLGTSFDTRTDITSLELSVVKGLAIRLSEEQLTTLSRLLENRVAILTGGPGTGKTTLIRSVCAVMGERGARILLAAPTGRAARRLSDVTGRKAQTLHRLLKYNQLEGRFEMNTDHPLDVDLLIVDEASMVDILLMYHLLCAVPITARLLFVGDVSQLPSVGPGNVLGDMMASGRIPSFVLTTIFRQAAESPIILNAHLVNQGRMPEFLVAEDGSLSEFYFIRQSCPEKVVHTIITLCSQRIPERFGFDPLKEVQVLTPMHRGEVGTLYLNQVLQNALNPLTGDRKKQLGFFRVGDKVIHLKNNYKKEVFNGDIGQVCDIEEEGQVLVVDYSEGEGDRQVSYSLEELDELALAYAISVHKSQGSEYPVVIIPLMLEHAPLLQRNLVYTAMTRGKRLVIFVGMSQALDMAIRNDRPTRRFSDLARRLDSLMTPPGGFPLRQEKPG
ncbi:ATP-dependent RecD-like DNA helicase [Desulfobotulus sp. H1]|uniref:ATP-dependent RecD-like DNA helicase n=1 Tax=Desulfobotulus pelophilus TaxID=2823377 RepID=A0ABT3N992_9BACT|nr:ATP-dependent RecD-like DNA helicase [Desulfobotulus pelophilus]MCW7754031.1 ATP-dependent RecD-like DNA helicase [Desulfobotulus pelophilus]